MLLQSPKKEYKSSVEYSPTRSQTPSSGRNSPYINQPQQSMQESFLNTSNDIKNQNNSIVILNNKKIELSNSLKDNNSVNIAHSSKVIINKSMNTHEEIQINELQNSEDNSFDENNKCEPSGPVCLSTKKIVNNSSAQSQNSICEHVKQERESSCYICESRVKLNSESWRHLHNDFTHASFTQLSDVIQGIIVYRYIFYLVIIMQISFDLYNQVLFIFFFVRFSYFLWDG